MKIEELVEILHLEVSERQLSFAHFLEQNGYKFLVDFGFENAEAKTWALLDPVTEVDEDTCHISRPTIQ